MNQNYDVIIIGGGATGLGVAIESVSRGYKTILFEQEDFGKSTSSKSTKLVHGGIRYLANLDFKLVKEGLEERYFFINNSRHLSKVQPYLIPFYSYKNKIKFTIGTFLYDLLASRYNIGKSKSINANDVIKLAPFLKTKNLIGGLIYYDGQFDDSRMLISMLRTFENLDGVAHNYHQVIAINKNNNNVVTGVTILDKINNKIYEVKSKVVINATGVFTDDLINMSEDKLENNNLVVSQGSHILCKNDNLKSEYAVVIPETKDDRILFILPWHDCALIGTTDVKVSKPVLDPIASKLEVKFIMDSVKKFSKHEIKQEDIKSSFAGLRPLVKKNSNTNSSTLSRAHKIIFSSNKLISVVGGKWTIYRRMGEDTINFAIQQGMLPKSNSITKYLKLFGWTEESIEYPLSVYGKDYYKILDIQKELNNYELLHKDLPYYYAEVIYQIKYEMVKTVEDVLSRRTRAVILNPIAAVEVAPIVANLIAKYYNYDDNWISDQLNKFNSFAKNYIVKLD